MATLAGRPPDVRDEAPALRQLERTPELDHRHHTFWEVWEIRERLYLMARPSSAFTRIEWVLTDTVSRSFVQTRRGFPTAATAWWAQGFSIGSGQLLYGDEAQRDAAWARFAADPSTLLVRVLL